MSITMQGNWDITVKSKSASFPQHFVIQGSESADNIYDGIVGSAPVHVTGAQWSITIEHNPTGPVSWTPSADRLTWPTLSAGQIKFDIRSNDSGADQDYDDLILTCSTPVNDSEFVLYGKVQTYSGLCRFNPCFPFPWVVIDTVGALKELLQYPSLRAVLEKLYPERLKVIRHPFPEPDPAPFLPMMIPLSEVTEDITPQAFERKISAETQATAQLEMRQARRSLSSAVFRDLSPYVSDVAKLVDRFHFFCSVEERPGLLLRFLEYDRTAAELTGGPYTGTGNRQILGLTVSDEQGNYIFRFTRTLADIAEEFDDVPAGGVLATELRPDVIVQVISGGATTSVLFETALYANIPTLKRIDLCFPESALNPGLTACQGGRAIQAIGNIFTLSGVGNTLDTVGRITATHPSGPQITRGAWVGGLHMFACFTDHPSVNWYTIRFRKPGGSWSFVQETYTHINIPFIGDPGNLAHKVGPFSTQPLAVDGGAPKPVPAYKNIELDPQWIITHRLRKIILSSNLYASLLYPGVAAGTVEFRIEGYNATGDKVAGADDTITLFIDNRPIFGNIDTISMGGVAPGECGLFDLPALNEPLTMRFKIEHPGGFLAEYGVKVQRGSATDVPVADFTTPLQPLHLVYNEPTHGSFFLGTFNGVSPDGDAYVVAELQPTSGTWLPAGKEFCAFSFEIDATPRTTDGYSLGGQSRLDLELIGISYSPPPGP
jgi:hypothetical protein